MAPAGPMTRWAAVALTATTLACDAFAPAGTAVRRPPTARFDTTAYDAGSVRQGTPVTYTFTLHNGGDRDLTLDTLRAGCACSAQSLPGRVVPPGGSATIGVRCETGGDRGPTTRTVTVYTNDPAQTVTTLTLTAEVSDGLAAQPRELYVGRVRRGQRVAREVRLLADTPTRLGEVAADGPGPVVEPRVLRGDPVGTTAAIGIAIRGDAPLGAFREPITVRTGHADGPALEVPVVGVVEEGAPPGDEATR